MSGKPVVIGPFIGGLNNVSKAGESEDAEVVDLINFEVTTDKALTSRPPIQIVTGSNLAGATVTWTVLGIYRLTNSSWYVIVQKAVGSDWSVGHMLLGDAASYVQIKLITGTANKVTAMVQVNDTLYFSTGLGSTQNGFYWKFGDGAVTETPTMPKGYTMVVFKSRIWLAGQDDANNGSTLWFTTIDSSGVLKFDTWTTSTDFIKVAPGEGGNITALLALNNSIIVFKNDGTWRFSYPSKPSQGQIDRLSGTIGAAGPMCVAEFENYVYVYDQGKVYELVSNVFTQINRIVKFEADTSAVDVTSTYGADLSVVSRRLILRYFNTLYSYNLDTRAWSQWRSSIGVPGKFWELPADSNSSSASKYIAASQGLTQNSTGNLLTSDKMDQTYIQSQAGSNFTITTTGSSITAVCNVNSNLTLFLNGEQGTSNFDLPIGGGYRVRVEGNATASIVVNVIFKLKNGTTSTLSSTPLTGVFSHTTTSPIDAIQCYVTLTKASMVATNTVTISALSVSRASTTAPVNLLLIQDDYVISSSSVEYIECTIRTKSYDYQAPTMRKRLFWWAIDAKTNQKMRTRTIPIAKALPVTHAALAAYTHSQLSFGTWGNPTSFLNPTLVIIDSQELANSATENGRILAKNFKSLRFRQISFEVTMKTFGESTTGPCKLFGITSYVLPKEKVSAEVS